jgi:hypothetical protein
MLAEKSKNPAIPHMEVEYHSTELPPIRRRRVSEVRRGDLPHVVDSHFRRLLA